MPSHPAWREVPRPIRLTLVLIGVTLGPFVFGCIGVPIDRRFGADLSAVGVTEAERLRVVGAAEATGGAAPSVRFPAVLAVAEIAATEPSHALAHDAASREVTLVHRDAFPTERDLGDLAALPGMLAAARLDPLVAPAGPTDADRLRRAALAQRADLLLVYTFDTFATSDDKLPLASALTLGVLPTHAADARSNAQAVLLDTRTGYIYGLAHADVEAVQLANAYSTPEARLDALERAERRAFARLMARFPDAWRAFVALYRRP